jgi:two-component system, cell cycle sensor histidine kinase and response regulator CckA
MQDKTKEQLITELDELRKRVAELEKGQAESKPAEDALQSSEKRYRQLFESANDGILILDADTGQVVDVNPSLLRLLGCSYDELIGKHLWETCSFKNIAAPQEAFKAIQDKAFVHYEDWPLETHLGKSIDVEFSSNICMDGRKLIQCIINDITERKQLELKAARLAAVVEFSEDAIIGKNLDGIITSWNLGAEKIYGYRESEVIGKSISMLLPSDSKHEVQLIIGKIKSEDRVEHYETKRRRKDGKIIWMSLTISPVRNAEGRVVAVSVIGRDITRRRKTDAERKLCFRAINQAGENIIITDAKGIIQFVNPAFERTTGYTREEALGKNPNILKSGKHDELFYQDLWDTISGGRTWTGRMINKRKDGGLYTEESTIAPVRDALGQTINYVAVKRDVTEQLRLAAQFQQVQKMEAIGQLAGGVAHDFNNMLSVILGYAEMALEKVDPAQPLHADLEEIHNAAMRSSEITRQLLAFARKQTIIPEMLDLNQNVESILKMLRRLIGEQIELVWKPKTDLWPVKMDPVQVDQILANLCVNARDAIADVGKITLETGNVVVDETYCAQHDGFVEGEYALLVVSDDGCGMGQEILDRIFEPFFTSKGVGQGTGLGLSTVYGVVKQNNGFINVYSEPGQGTTFRIYLPRYTDLSADIREEKAVEIPLSRGETVLLVEDQPELLIMAKMMLERLDYRVLTADKPSEALRQAEEHASEIQILITDVVMPEMNGRNLAERLQSLYPNLKTLFMSGYTANVIVNKGVLDPGVNFIQKPFSMKDLAAKVWEALRKK